MCPDDGAPVVLGAKAPIVRRRVGATAWCVVELLTLSCDAMSDPSAAATVDASVSSVALGLGVSENTAQRALDRRSGLPASSNLFSAAPAPGSSMPPHIGSPSRWPC